jgi:hypothetical protein
VLSQSTSSLVRGYVKCILCRMGPTQRLASSIFRRKRHVKFHSEPRERVKFHSEPKERVKFRSETTE